ncbi:MAG: hypothetical protein DME86_03085 [Verrucomicrobia bacterium]|nr:MAG: hypothetical protein DME86_03085 [Verrucomicrobiota bacterium]
MKFRTHHTRLAPEAFFCGSALGGYKIAEFCSHFIHTCAPSVPASGWRLETEEKTDKKKSNFYFFTSRKKFLTEKIIGLLARFLLSHDDLEQSSLEDFPLNFAVPPPIMRDRNCSKMNAPPAFSIRLAIFVLAAALSLASVQAAPGRSGQISHVVLFWLKRPGNVDDQNVLLRAARSFRRIKGVSDVRVGRSLPVARPVEQSFDIGLVITFKDAGALKKFERNQRHQQVVEAALRPLVRRYIVYNFSNE